MIIRINKKKTVEEIDQLRQAVRNNKGYCPCKVEHIPENRCICSELLNNHICECGLYEYVSE